MYALICTHVYTYKYCIRLLMLAIYIYIYKYISHQLYISRTSNFKWCQSTKNKSASKILSLNHQFLTTRATTQIKHSHYSHCLIFVHIYMYIYIYITTDLMLWRTTNCKMCRGKSNVITQTNNTYIYMYIYKYICIYIQPLI